MGEVASEVSQATERVAEIAEESISQSVELSDSHPEVTNPEVGAESDVGLELEASTEIFSMNSSVDSMAALVEACGSDLIDIVSSVTTPPTNSPPLSPSWERTESQLDWYKEFDMVNSLST